jgi:hypothetical protein
MLLCSLSALKRRSANHSEKAHGWEAGLSQSAGPVFAALSPFPFSIRAATSAEKAKRFFDRARLNKLRTRQFDPKATFLMRRTVGKREKAVFG